jgi:site-specific DNA recombinase
MQSNDPLNAPTVFAAIYCRISKDRTGAGLGVDRQESDCRILAERFSMQVTHLLADNDLSAYSGKPRPGYQELLQLIRSGTIQTVIAWHTDRLHRSPVELEEFITACEIYGVDVRTVQAGAIDLSSASGRMGARIYGAVARHEVEHAIERVKAAKLQSARAGIFSGGQRPWGYEPGCTAIREDEAAIYKDMVNRVLDGNSFNRVAQNLNDSGITTQHGKPWNALKVRNLLLHARYAGVREHHGQHYPAQWPAIIDKQTWDDLQLAMRARALRYKQGGPGRPRKFLLTGIAYCGICGKRLNCVPKQKRDGTYYSRYVCVSKDSGNGAGCGKIMRIIEPVDLLIAECIIYRLESPAFDRAMTQEEKPGNELRDLIRKQSSQAERVKEIRDDYASGELNKAEYQSLIQTAQARLLDLTRQVDRAQPVVQPGPLPESHVARQVWESADLARRRQIVELLIDKVRIMPSNVSRLQRGQYFYGFKFIPEDVVIGWKE